MRSSDWSSDVCSSDLEVVHVPGRRDLLGVLRAGIDALQVDHRAAGAKLHQADALDAALLAAAQHLGVELHGALAIADADHHMVEVANGEGHRRYPLAFRPATVHRKRGHAATGAIPSTAGRGSRRG